MGHHSAELKKRSLQGCTNERDKFTSQVRYNFDSPGPEVALRKMTPFSPMPVDNEV